MSSDVDERNETREELVLNSLREVLEGLIIEQPPKLEDSWREELEGLIIEPPKLEDSWREELEDRNQINIVGQSPNAVEDPVFG